MAKPLKDVLSGVKSSKVEKLDHKDMYQWNAPDGLKFVDDKHPVEKHADRVGNGDDVYQGKTKPAKYPRQDAKVYEESDVNIIDQKLGAGEEKTAYIEERRYLQRAAERVAATKKRANQKLEDIARAERKRKESMERQEKEIQREREEEARQRDKKRRQQQHQMKEDYGCNHSTKGVTCEVHGDDQCPDYNDKKGRKLLMDKKANEAIEIGKALRVGNQFTDSHLARDKRNPSTLGKPANLLDRANKTIGKLKGSTFMVKKMTEEEQLNELSPKVLRSFIQAVPQDVTKRAAEYNKNIGKMTVSDIKAATDKVLNRVSAQKQAAEKLKGKENLDEVAPPGLESWIKSNKERFVKEYGKKKGLEVLYAKAWKMHGQSESGTSSPATNTDYAGPGAAGWTTGRLDVGTLE